MSPYPMDVAHAVGPARLVLSTYPSRESALRAANGAVERRLAVCGTLVEAESRYWWKGTVVAAPEVLVLFKTVPKRVGALFAYLQGDHPYVVPEILEVDVPRVGAGYLTYLARTIDSKAPPPPLGGGSTRREVPRGREARVPARTRAQRRRPSK
ncbi:MAG: divalent-cation tolerance protein CutA [Thermoplasmata archaeon]